MSGDCGQRNCNAYKPTDVGGYALLCCSYFPVAFASFLIGIHIWGYYSLYVFGLLTEHGGLPAARFLYALAITTGTMCIGLVVTSYLRTVLTPPGYVPAEPWARQPIVITNRQVPPTDHDHFVATVTTRRELRYCRRCAQFKPDDAHHCSQCQRCVLRMDHHCPWVNNCVGRDNTKYFVLFLCWLGFSCIYFLLQIIVAYAVLPVTFSITSAAGHLGLFMLTIGLGIFGVFMSCFGAFHLQMIRSGNSTLGEVMDHQPKEAQFREVFGSPNASGRGAWYHFLPLAPLNRRPRHRPRPAVPASSGAGGPSSSDGGFALPIGALPAIGKGLNEADVNDANSSYFTPRPPTTRPPPLLPAEGGSSPPLSGVGSSAPPLPLAPPLTSSLSHTVINIPSAPSGLVRGADDDGHESHHHAADRSAQRAPLMRSSAAAVADSGSGMLVANAGGTASRRTASSSNTIYR